jgi:hypothetical protein
MADVVATLCVVALFAFALVYLRVCEALRKTRS